MDLDVSLVRCYAIGIRQHIQEILFTRMELRNRKLSFADKKEGNVD